MHAHQYTWHNDDLLGNNAVNVVKHLSVDRVLRLGYVSLRCTLRPGCPSHLHPAHAVKSLNHPEEIFWPRAWRELFPFDPIPNTVSQSCCGQFAVSKARIRGHSLAHYRHFRDWLITTELEDSISGRIWEYLWQILFSGEDEYCPPQNVCLCDGYGICFGSESEYDGWMNKTGLLKQHSVDGGEVTPDVVRLREEITVERLRAFERGRNPVLRAAEVSQQCQEPGSMAEWNSAAVSWPQSLACRKEIREA